MKLYRLSIVPTCQTQTHISTNSQYQYCKDTSFGEDGVALQEIKTMMMMMMMNISIDD